VKLRSVGRYARHVNDSLEDRVEAQRRAREAAERQKSEAASADERALEEFVELMNRRNAPPDWCFAVEERREKTFFSGRRVEFTFTGARQGFVIATSFTEWSPYESVTMVDRDGQLFAAKSMTPPTEGNVESYAEGRRTIIETIVHSELPLVSTYFARLDRIPVLIADEIPELPKFRRSEFDQYAYVAGLYLDVN
jgi:hypothetical protein